LTQQLRASQDFHSKTPIWHTFIEDTEEEERRHFMAYSLAAMRIGAISNSDTLIGETTAEQGPGETKRSWGKTIASKATFMGFDSFNMDDPMAVRIAKSVVFKTVCVVAIFLNTIWIAINADLVTKNKFKKLEGDEDTELESRLEGPEWAFTVWFTIELIIRMAAEKWEFITGKEYGWNFCDSFLVINSYIQLLFSISGNFSFIRILRVFRLTRVVKVIKTVPWLRSLRTMVFSIMNSFVNLLWALLVLLLVIFMFSIIFQNGVTSYIDKAESEDELATARNMKANFGDLYETMVSLLCSVTGGNDWFMYAELLRECQPKELYLMIFMFYIVFTVVGLLNVVTGIFVDSAVCTRTEDEVIETWKSEQKNTCETLRTIFKDGDADCSGAMSLTEFQAHLNNPWVRAYFSGLEIDPSDAVSIFTLIAREGHDEVKIDEFIAGMMKLKGHAKSVDVLTLMYDQARQTAQLNKFMNYVEEQLIKIQAAPSQRSQFAEQTTSITDLGRDSRKALAAHNAGVRKSAQCNQNEPTIAQTVTAIVDCS